MKDEMETLILRANWGGIAPDFCDLDEVVDTPAEYGDPVEMLIRKEKETGYGIAFQREVDDVIHFARIK